MSEHTRHAPYSSPTSSLSSVGSVTNESFGSNPLPYGDRVDKIIRSSEPNGDLYERAQKHLSVLLMERFKRYNEPAWLEKLKKAKNFKTTYTTISMFKAMYDTARDLKLPSGARYVSAAVCACAAGSKEAESERSLTDSERREAEAERLAASLEKLASTWVSYMLWPMVADSPSAIRGLESLSGLATPTADETASTINNGLSPHRQGDFPAEVKRRDGYQCLFTGWFDDAMPAAMRPDGAVFVPLQAAHIFKRAVAVVDPEEHYDKYKSTLATLNILKHYCDLDPKFLELLDEAHNGIALQHDVHYFFDRMEWCLAPTEEAGNTYEVRLMPRYRGLKPIKTHHTFVDHSCPEATVESTPTSAERKRLHDEVGIALPNPTLLRMHAALAKVLHASGAAEIFDAFLLQPSSSAGPVIAAEYGLSFAENIVDGKLDVVAAFELAQMSSLDIVCQ